MKHYIQNRKSNAQVNAKRKRNNIWQGDTKR